LAVSVLANVGLGWILWEMMSRLREVAEINSLVNRKFSDECDKNKELTALEGANEYSEYSEKNIVCNFSVLSYFLLRWGGARTSS